MDVLDAIVVLRALWENALAQRGAGASRVEVEVYGDGVQVRDDGPGLPVHPHPRSGRSLLEVILTGPRRGPLNTLARVTRSCLWLEVRVGRDEGVYRQRYDFAAPGVLEGPLASDEGPDRGTTIRCAPAQGELPALDALAAELAPDLPAGLEVVLRDRRTGAELRLEGGPRA
ncbi:MAG: hypothetical protein R3F62_22255 [Planctomycetota bacterium]